MGSFSFWHWLIVLLVILIIFGAGKLPKVAGDLASGIKNFRKGMSEDDAEKEETKTVEHKADEPIRTTVKKTSES